MRTNLEVRISDYANSNFPHLIEFPNLEEVLRRQSGVVIQQVASRPLGSPAVGVELKNVPSRAEIHGFELDLTLHRDTHHRTLKKKLVFGGLRDSVNRLYGVQRIETAADGRGSEIALRVLPRGGIRGDRGRSGGPARTTPRWVMRAILLRRGQDEFRRQLIEIYDEKCVVTGCRIVAILEAAHVRPVSDGGETAAGNGLLLRADIHTLFDLDLLGIDPQRREVVLAPALAESEYANLNGKRVRLEGLQQAYLDERWLRFQASA